MVYVERTNHGPKLVLALFTVAALAVLFMDWKLIVATAAAGVPRPPHPDETTLMAELALHTTPTVSDDAPRDVFVPRNTRFLTLADDTSTNICLLAATIFQQGSVLEVLGWNFSETFFDGTSCGARCKSTQRSMRFGQEKKLYWLLHYFENKPDLHDDDIVLFTDAWDVVVNGDLNTLVDLFLRQTNHTRGVIFNGEPACGDSFALSSSYGDKLRDRHWRVQLEVGQKPRMVRGRDACSAIAAKTLSSSLIPGPNWSLGSGGILGDVRSIRSFLRKVHQIRREQEELYEKNPTDEFLFEGDQILFQLAYLQSPEINAKVDASGEIFFVISYLVTDGDFDEFSPGSGCTSNYMAHGQASVYAWNRVAPVFFHFPGDYKGMYGSCAEPASRYREALGATHYMMDVDRNTRIRLRDICPRFN